MYKTIFSLLSIIFINQISISQNTKEHVLPLVSRIAFGSCGHEDAPQPILAQAAAHKPDVFIWLGDNIYGDTDVMDTLRAKYGRLSAKPEFQKLKKTSRFIATWDDHDYGRNDAGRHYPYKLESKEIFLNFWDVPKNDIRRQREGIYTSYFFKNNNKTLQIIVLDMRTFRDDLRFYKGEKKESKYFYDLDYLPYETTDSTLLGEKQWAWLEEQLKVPADIRIIASSTQFSIAFNGYEAWANFPHERARFVNLIKKTRANGVFFISGDVHYAELSRLEFPDCYPLYDLTASGITSTWYFATPNENRLEGPIMDNHFGMIDIDWSLKVPNIRLKIYDVRKTLRINKRLNLSELRFKN
jgi:alkaline phosphatase D